MRLLKNLRVNRRRLRIMMLAMVGLWIIVCAAIALLVVVVGDQNNAQKSDVIIVLGSGLRRDGHPGDALWRRSLVAADAYHAGFAPHIICTGGVSENQSRSEAAGCRDVLLGEGVPDSAIFLEETSHSTEENAINSNIIMHANAWHTAVIVTDSFHIMRAGWIFTSENITHTRYPVPRNRVRIWWYATSLAREVVAVQWQAFKSILGLEITKSPF